MAQSKEELNLLFHGVTVKMGEKPILKDVYGRVEAGQLMAIMGPSGGGKTTLLNTLSGRMPVEEGEVLLNGSALTRASRRKICYVLQQDAFFSNLTLHETLKFTAMLRLPDEMSVEDKMRQLDQLIDDLDLRKCCNTVMGGPWVPGLSGGETKRASIACELITNPTLILLDEPTSGLDYKTAFSLVETLRNYASVHRKTVVTTIHQPSSQIFSQFHLLLLLCDGHTIYYGPPSDVTDFFSHIGYDMLPHYNPADFILEKLKEGPDVTNKIIEGAYSTRMITRSGLSRDIDRADGKQWNTLVLNQPLGQTSNISQDSENVHATFLTPEEKQQKWPTGFWTQYKQLSIRAFKQSRTNLFNKFKIFETAFLCVLLSLIWFRLPRSEDTLRDRMGLIFYISMHWGFTPLFDAVTSFPMEKVVIYKERSSGWYRLSAYYLAKMTSELPVILLPPVVFLMFVYWITGLNNASSFFATIGTIFVHSITGQSIGLVIGIFCMDMRRGISLATVFIMFFMLIGGFYTRHLPFWLDWAKYLAFLYYTFHCLMYLEFYNGSDLKCTELGNATKSAFDSCVRGTNSTTPVSIPSAQVLQYYGIDLPFWQYFLPLFIFLVFFRVLGYLVLRFYQKPK